MENGDSLSIEKERELAMGSLSPAIVDDCPLILAGSPVLHDSRRVDLGSAPGAPVLRILS